MTQRSRAWRRRQQRRILFKIQHSHLWLWNQLFAPKEKLLPIANHMVNPKKTQLQRLHGHIQAVRESLRANDDPPEIVTE
ncbi:MAG: hypothetical protein ACHQ50_06300 [Fimbriimonadales bacterium]